MSDDDSPALPRRAAHPGLPPEPETGEARQAVGADTPREADGQARATEPGATGEPAGPDARAASDDRPAPGHQPVDEASSQSRRTSGTGFWRELPVLVVVALALALVIKAFLVQAFYIPSGSMEQTLAISDRVLVNKLVYDFRDVRRGEIIVFNGAGSFSPDPDQQFFAEPGNPVQRALRSAGGLVGLGTPGETDFIKRVIGISGDRVACCTNGHVTVQPPGGAPIELTETYTHEDDQQVFCQAGSDDASCPPGAPGVLVPDGRLFVLGDHRCCSSDSRFHLDDGQNGTVPVDAVIGRAFVVVWPLGHATLLSVPDTFDGRVLAAAAPAAPYALGAVGALPLALLLRRRRRRAR